MLKRTFIVLAVIAAFIFLPYFIGCIFDTTDYSNFFENPDPIFLWMLGVMLILCVFGVILISVVIIEAIFTYIKNGDKTGDQQQ